MVEIIFLLLKKKFVRLIFGQKSLTIMIELLSVLNSTK